MIAVAVAVIKEKVKGQFVSTTGGEKVTVGGSTYPLPANTMTGVVTARENMTVV